MVEAGEGSRLVRLALLLLPVSTVQRCVAPPTPLSSFAGPRVVEGELANEGILTMRREEKGNGDEGLERGSGCARV
jgi:hypothetical protein